MICAALAHISVPIMMTELCVSDNTGASDDQEKHWNARLKSQRYKGFPDRLSNRCI